MQLFCICNPTTLIRPRCYFAVSETEKSSHTSSFSLPSLSCVSPTCQTVGTNMLTKLHAGAAECRPVLIQNRLEEGTQSSRWSFALFSSAPSWCPEDVGDMQSIELGLNFTHFKSAWRGEIVSRDHPDDADERAQTKKSWFHIKKYMYCKGCWKFQTFCSG